MKRRCCGCKDYYPKDGCIKINAGYFHSYECATQYAQDKSRKLRQKKEDREHQQRKKELRSNDKKIQKEKTKTLCHRYIRLRDIDLPCISCGRYDHEIPDVLTGGKWDAGHFKTKGAYPELRFEELNIHKQCKSCNGGSGRFTKKERTVSAQYRKNLIKKIGLENVEWLEGPHEAKKYTIDDLKQLQDVYRQKINGGDLYENLHKV